MATSDLAEAPAAFRLDVADLACIRAGRRVLAGVSFRLEAGDALVVTGRNGAGKSTLLAALAGLLRPERGRIELAPGEGPRGERLHLLGHRDGLKAQLTPAENLRFSAACLGGRGLEIGAALARVGLGAAADLPSAYLSAGQRRRLGLARLLVSPRPLWLLDEPTSALDAEGQALLDELMAAHRAAGGAILAATHSPLPLPGARTLRLGRPGTA
ncbi:heme ABC exporter ATP-binding protein CcmA [Enterovirga sp.]|uniref:heme ABC exporter ATP-binding protein CcmA n=1 Tax=Enterovirga sp. TaxID=2026350 RepID=UPI002C776507|nr:heme ABC exporter ATP-binding protein CcmA [Enterovirga sp.]HMO30997.1 heme ABC exporter ATP-binding protein CcmA [Enterovirga sp.]